MSAQITNNDTVYSINPLYHPSGLLTSIGGAIAGGARLAIVAVTASALPEQIEQCLGQEPAVGPLALTEVGGQLQTLAGHSCSPIHWPSHAAATPNTTLPTMFAAAVASRAVS